MKLSFHGAAGCVSGSRHLVQAKGGSVLVDCGLFQGYKLLRLRNWEPFPMAPPTLASVVLTHAHLDHSGALPRLMREGFRGPIHCTEATAALCRILLPDSGRLQEEEANYANRKRFSKHHPALPLYTEEDARQVLKQLEPHGWGEAFAPAAGMEAVFSPAGHILGAASVRLAADGTSVLFSGDVGRAHDVVMKPPAAAPAADVVVIESTYGGRTHPPGDPLDAVAQAVTRAAVRGGVIVVPTFAVGRAQALLYVLHALKEARRIPDIPVFLNSPMAADATGIFHRFRSEHRLDEATCRATCGVARIVNTPEESKALNLRHGPMIILSASGMATGGRVLHHLAAFAPDERNMILLTGYQAAGTRGASLAAGAAEIKIHGRYVPVRAQVVTLDMFSAHADEGELVAWLATMPEPPRRVFITHGEPGQSDALRVRIADRLGWPCTIPQIGDAFEI